MAFEATGVAEAAGDGDEEGDEEGDDEGSAAAACRAAVERVKTAKEAVSVVRRKTAARRTRLQGTGHHPGSQPDDSPRSAYFQARSSGRILALAWMGCAHPCRRVSHPSPQMMVG
jgi:hypothetical protein